MDASLSLLAAALRLSDRSALSQNSFAVSLCDAGRSSPVGQEEHGMTWLDLLLLRMILRNGRVSLQGQTDVLSGKWELTESNAPLLHELIEINVLLLVCCRVDDVCMIGVLINLQLYRSQILPRTSTTIYH